MTRIVFLFSCFAFGTAFGGGGDQYEVKVGLFSIFQPSKISVSSAAKGCSLKIVYEGSKSGAKKINVSEAVVTCRENVGVKLSVGKKTIDAYSLRIRDEKSNVLFVGVPGKQHQRAYSGSLEVHGKNGQCVLTNMVPLDDYVRSVTCQEIRGGLGQALKAQAVLVRTWALTHMGRHGKNNQDFCDLTHCQVYKGVSACDESQLADLIEVKNKVLKFGTVLADVAYFSTCGGQTGSAGDIWGEKSDRVYLRGVDDGDPAYCSNSPHFRWRFSLPRSEVCRALVKKKEKGSDCGIEIMQTGKGGWVKSLRIISGKKYLISGEKFRMLMGRSFGWGRFKSSNFFVNMDKDMVEFIGKGLGHGVGMCQYGAMRMARDGKTFTEILKHYFPHTEVRNFREP